MTNPIPKPTRSVLGEKAEKCESRSLYISRFADPQSKETARENWFARLCKLGTYTSEKRDDRFQWLPENNTIVEARLRDRGSNRRPSCCRGERGVVAFAAPLPMNALDRQYQ